jgi:hypothetical protein
LGDGWVIKGWTALDIVCPQYFRLGYNFIVALARNMLIVALELVETTRTRIAPVYDQKKRISERFLDNKLFLGY